MAENYELGRERIARAEGWIWDAVCKCFRRGDEIAFNNRSPNHRQIPDYFHDLNAMAKAENTLSEEQLTAMNEVMYCDMPEIKRVWRATAAQRAAAFLRVVDANV